jgi:CubicO group peptidase (beta-lactamase class C family)
MAVDRGLLALDAPVADYWPEFAALGKDTITVRQVLAHRAGLPAPLTDLTPADLLAWDPVVQALAEQAPAWVPGTQYAYHALTVGWLAGEVLRRTTGMRPAEWLARHVAGPLGLEMAFGVDPSAPDLALMQTPLPITDEVAAAELASAFSDPEVVRALSLGSVLDPADLFGSFNRPDILRAEIPAGGLVTNARSLARLYAATVGEVEGVRLLPDSILDDALAVQSEGPPFSGPDAGHRWGTGFMLNSVARPMLGPGSFGHDGAGGQLAFGHRGHGIGFGYQTNRPGGIPDDRADALCRALQTCLPDDAQDDRR